MSRRSFWILGGFHFPGVPFNSPESKGPVILELPLDKIRRPLLRTRSNDLEKVKELMESITEIGLQVPVIAILLVSQSWILFFDELLSLLLSKNCRLMCSRLMEYTTVWTCWFDSIESLLWINDVFASIFSAWMIGFDFRVWRMMALRSSA